MEHNSEALLQPSSKANSSNPSPWDQMSNGSLEGQYGQSLDGQDLYDDQGEDDDEQSAPMSAPTPDPLETFDSEPEPGMDLKFISDCYATITSHFDGAIRGISSSLENLFQQYQLPTLNVVDDAAPQPPPPPQPNIQQLAQMVKDEMDMIRLSIPASLAPILEQLQTNAISSANSFVSRCERRIKLTNMKSDRYVQEMERSFRVEMDALLETNLQQQQAMEQSLRELQNEHEVVQIRFKQELMDQEDNLSQKLMISEDERSRLTQEIRILNGELVEAESRGNTAEELLRRSVEQSQQSMRVLVQEMDSRSAEHQRQLQAAKEEILRAETLLARLGIVSVSLSNNSSSSSSSMLQQSSSAPSFLLPPAIGSPDFLKCAEAQVESMLAHSSGIVGPLQLAQKVEDQNKIISTMRQRYEWLEEVNAQKSREISKLQEHMLTLSTKKVSISSVPVSSPPSNSVSKEQLLQQSFFMSASLSPPKKPARDDHLPSSMHPMATRGFVAAASSSSSLPSIAHPLMKDTSPEKRRGRLFS